jgi:hypothetical protein
MSEYKMHQARERRLTSKRKQAWEEESIRSGRSTLQPGNSRGTLLSGGMNQH